MISAHDGAINAITVRENKLFTSGSTDKKLKVWDVNSMNVEKTIQLSSYARAIDYKNNLILVGTRDGTILRIEG